MEDTAEKGARGLAWPRSTRGLLMMIQTTLNNGHRDHAAQNAGRHAAIRGLLLTVSIGCILIPLPLMGVMGYLVADGQPVAAYRAALASVMLCVCAIAAYLARKLF